MKKKRFVVVLVAIFAPIIFWICSVMVFGHDLRVAKRNDQPLNISLPLVITVATVFSLAGWGLLQLLEKISGKGTTIWKAIAAIVLLLSFLPLTGPGTPIVTRVVLGSMHVAVGGCLIFGLTRGRLQNR